MDATRPGTHSGSVAAALSADDAMEVLSGAREQQQVAEEMVRLRGVRDGVSTLGELGLTMT